MAFGQMCLGAKLFCPFFLSTAIYTKTFVYQSTSFLSNLRLSTFIPAALAWREGVVAPRHVTVYPLANIDKQPSTPALKSHRFTILEIQRFLRWPTLEVCPSGVHSFLSRVTFYKTSKKSIDFSFICYPLFFFLVSPPVWWKTQQSMCNVTNSITVVSSSTFAPQQELPGVQRLMGMEWQM